jgi:predicted secreted protein
MGAHSTYTEEKAEEICERLGEGIPLREICRAEGMPAWRTVYRWIEDDTDFAARIAHARARGFDAIAEECMEIADDARYDTRTAGSGDNTYEVANTEWIGRSKLRVETRLKLLAKWDPKRYGDKMDVTSAGDKLEAGAPLFNITLTTE